MKSILIPTDFSANAMNALNYAVKIAKDLNASTTILHVYHTPVVDINMPAYMIQDLALEADKRASEMISSIEKEVRTKYPDLEIRTVLENGYVIESICEFVEQEGIDLIIMGTKGASGIDEILIGSNTAKIIEAACCPVLAIPENAGYTKPQNILYASELEDDDVKTINEVNDFAALFNAKLKVLHVKNDEQLELVNTDIRITDLQKKFQNESIEFVLITSDEMLEGLDKYLDKKHPDILAIATHKRSFFEKLFHRSYAKRMAYHAKVPLIAFHK